MKTRLQIAAMLPMAVVLTGGVGAASGDVHGYDPDNAIGDFDDDGDIDVYDIDILCANMGGDPATYDMDGDVDEDDMIYHIENLVEWDDGLETGIGTWRGDFNIDGIINATDLAVIKGGFWPIGPRLCRRQRQLR